MAFDPSFIVHIEKKPDGSLGQTMNDIRAWLDHRNIQPALFKTANHGAGFEIAFIKEDEAHLFRHEFASIIRPSDPPD